MKLAVRIFALSVVFAGVAAVSVSSTPKSASKVVFVSHQAMSSAMPIPCTGPKMPSCISGAVK
jgi:hypothetical protein